MTKETKNKKMLQRETERAENKCQMYGLWDLPVFPEWQNLSAQFSWVLLLV